MRPRQEIVETFSTFAQLENDKFSKWLTDVRLRRSMERYLQNSPDTKHLVEPAVTGYFWSLYWYKVWRLNPKLSNLAKQHLSAYLQETCYWAAGKILARFNINQYGLADYFQMGIAELEKILEGYNPEKNSSLKTYASIAFPSRLKDILRQGKEADICTNWGLLRKVSKKLVLEALDNAGLSPTQISQYRLAWTCFGMLYLQNQPDGTQKLPEPNRQLWADIANLYNSERHSQLNPPGSECSPEVIEERLTKTAIYLRAYLYPSVASINIYNQEEDTSQEFEIKDPLSESLIAQIIAQEEAQERKNQLSQMNQVLVSAFGQLDQQSQTIFDLYYQQGMTQQQIIQELKISQPTVCRRLLKGRDSLLAALLNWRRETENISVNANQIKEMSAALEEWLNINYAQSGLRISSV
ncbi:RNA polymerase sigma factor, sigma-70 family [Cylindrospermum stagnale PCC 7417]|uniref:RNA polymerase sigma factor, sigma-70 family n=1 Tax=Cylindrospermum stagnale PCC 7417 TaxID=56107 RepID=K9WUB1_9NOST|nr:sigma-70 family RNA polymerase sigma factor [Cylindrospermum stagnale]AFZ23092.1 RNA polymerase sigma factor, sigma-70 family [Cylindrospermum stagnale PCC 7417]